MEGYVQRVSNDGGGCVKKIQLWGIVGELLNKNLVVGGGGAHYIQLGECEEETSYN